MIRKRKKYFNTFYIYGTLFYYVYWTFRLYENKSVLKVQIKTLFFINILIYIS